MPDSEWFAVETADGQPMAAKLPNIEAARKAGRELSADNFGVLAVVRYTRTELCTMERVISIKEVPPPA